MVSNSWGSIFSTRRLVYNYLTFFCKIVHCWMLNFCKIGHCLILFYRISPYISRYTHLDRVWVTYPKWCSTGNNHRNGHDPPGRDLPCRTRYYRFPVYCHVQRYWPNMTLYMAHCRFVALSSSPSPQSPHPRFKNPTCITLRACD
jgi:hypothetical protein